jgi:Protein of unknown function (DUF1579)
MKLVFKFIAVFVVGSCLFASAARAQQPQTPGKEHEEMKSLVGTWDATVKSPDGQESKGVAVYRMACEGMWLESEFNGDIGGQKFSGKGFDSYDSARKLYTATWVDSMSGSPLLLTGTKDASGKVLTMTGEMASPDGAVKIKTITKVESADKHIFRMLMDLGGSESEMLSITYVRRKDKK